MAHIKITHEALNDLSAMNQTDMGLKDYGKINKEVLADMLQLYKFNMYVEKMHSDTNEIVLEVQNFDKTMEDRQYKLRYERAYHNYNYNVLTEVF